MVSKKGSRKVQGESVVEAPIPEIRSDAETITVLTELLDQAPQQPEFTNMSEATTWIDRTYRPWINKVKQELGK